MFSGFARLGAAALFVSGAVVLAMTHESPPPKAEAADQPNRRGTAATSPPLEWRGVQRIAILCQVTAEVPVGNDVVAKTLCERVRMIAGRGAPVPVEVVGYGDPALRSPRAAVLFVQASVAEVAPSRLGLLFTARAERNGVPEEARSYFGSAPRIAPFTSATDGAAWDATVATALSEILPWLQRADAGDLLPAN